MKYFLTCLLALYAGEVLAASYKAGTNRTEAGATRTVIGGELDVISGGSLKLAGTAITSTAAEINAATDLSSRFEDVTATNVLGTAECGKVMTLNATTEFVSTLPAPTAGCSFKFIVKAAPSGASYTVVTASSANVIIGGINELEVDTGDDGPYINNGDTITFVNGVGVVGDWVACDSDGTSWYCTGQSNADGGITLTQAN
jgi:hypothetical protein